MFKQTTPPVLAAFVAACLAAGGAQAQISDNIIRIGVLTDMTGTYSDPTGKGAVEAVRLAVEEMGGSVNGKPVDVIFADHLNKPDIGAAIVNRWIDEEKLDAVVDVVTSSVALAVQDITRAKNRVHLNGAAATSELTSKACSPTGIQWTYDTYALANGTGGAMVKTGGDSWFFLTADYSFGHALERDAGNAVKAAGGKVLGAVKHPFPSQDFASFLLQAQASGAKVIGLANAGNDTINSIKQAAEFGLTQGGQTLAGLLVTITDIHALGLKAAQGLVLTEAFYWDYDDRTRAFAKRFGERMNGRMPTQLQAGDYSAVLHYLKAVKAANTDDAAKVVAKMREMPVDDAFARNGRIREDGRMVHDMLLLQVKKPEESKAPWDYYKVLRVIPGDEAFRPMDKGECPLVKKG